MIQHDLLHNLSIQVLQVRYQIEQIIKLSTLAYIVSLIITKCGLFLLIIFFITNLLSELLVP